MLFIKPPNMKYLLNLQYINAMEASIFVLESEVT